MMMVDARGYSCPIPVVMVQKAVKASQPQRLEVLVDNMCAVENVRRFGANAGYAVTVRPQGEDYALELVK